jgi:hypothetical protein
MAIIIKSKNFRTSELIGHRPIDNIMSKDFELNYIEPSSFSMNIQNELLNGPEWSRELYKQYINFLHNDMFGNLKKASGELKKSKFEDII